MKLQFFLQCYLNVASITPKLCQNVARTVSRVVQYLPSKPFRAPTSSQSHPWAFILASVSVSSGSFHNSDRAPRAGPSPSRPKVAQVAPKASPGRSFWRHFGRLLYDLRPRSLKASSGVQFQPKPILTSTELSENTGPLHVRSTLRKTLGNDMRHVRSPLLYDD